MSSSAVEFRAVRPFIHSWSGLEGDAGEVSVEWRGKARRGEGTARLEILEPPAPAGSQFNQMSAKEMTIGRCYIKRTAVRTGRSCSLTHSSGTNIGIRWNSQGQRGRLLNPTFWPRNLNMRRKNRGSIQD